MSLIGVPLLQEGSILFCAVDVDIKVTDSLTKLNFKVGLKARIKELDLIEEREGEEEIVLANARAMKVLTLN